MLNRINRAKDQKGFTLIELMIVVAIIGILAAIAIPNFRNYQMKAKRGEVPTNLKAIKTAEVAYQAELDTFVTLVASPAAAPGTGKNPWPNPTLAGWDSIGWQPSGQVYGQYDTSAAATATTVAGRGQSDIDGDAANAIYTFNVDISVPSNDTDVISTTASNVF